MPDTERIRIVFDELVPMTGPVLKQGEVFIERGVIQEIRTGRSSEFEGRTLDLSDHLLLPGFVNAHCHLSLSGLAGAARQTARFTDWIQSVVAANQALDWGERVAALQREAAVLLKTGVTCLGDYLSHAELWVEYAALPFRQVLFLECIGFQATAVETVPSRVESVLQTHAGHDNRLRIGLAPHAPYSVSPELFRALRQLADRYGCPLSCHLGEVPAELEFLNHGQGEFANLLRARGVWNPDWRPPGSSPARYLDTLGMLDGLVAVHCNHVEEDLELLAGRGARAVFCPGSTRWFGRTHWMPVREFLDRGMAVGLGTDSLASNESLSFLRELRLAAEMLPEVCPEELLWMATAGGGRVLGLPAGELRSGWNADMIGFRKVDPEVPWWQVPFEGSRREVDFVMIGGKVLLPD